MTIRNNIVKCSWCGKILIAEQYDSHECDIPWKDSKEIPVSSIFDCTTKRGEAKVGVGLDGIRYWFVVKKREPLPWPSTESLQGDNQSKTGQNLVSQSLFVETASEDKPLDA